MYDTNFLDTAGNPYKVEGKADDPTNLTLKLGKDGKKESIEVKAPVKALNAPAPDRKSVV